jgi:hypothetical protein
MATNLDTLYNWRHKYKNWKKIHDKHQNKNKLEQLKEKLSKERNSQKFNLEPETSHLK